MFLGRWRKSRSAFSPRWWSGWWRRAGRGGSGGRRSAPLGVLLLEDRLTLSTLIDLASFNGTNGNEPRSPELLQNGTLYGTTFIGGAFNYGTIYKLNLSTDKVVTLASFDGTNTGASPTGPLLMDSSGNLYGTTELGGASGDGTVFELPKGSSTITVLASFNLVNGANPRSGLIRDSNGNFYGTAFIGGPYGDGTVFELAKGSNTITTLASFDGTNGKGPYCGLLMDNSGNLYGTTFFGGPSGFGTVFELAQGSGTITTLASFDGTNGRNPYNIGGLIMDANGNLYGTTYGGPLTSPPPPTARCSSWSRAATRLPPWPRSTAPTAPTR
jgi:uncharacterized repeat protein (TIGR03803 family)